MPVRRSSWRARRKNGVGGVGEGNGRVDGWLAGWLAGRVSRPIDIIITNSHRVVKCLSPSEARVRRTGGGLIKRGHRTARRVMRIS